MGAQQRKAVEVLLYRLHRDLPAKYRVALRAVRSELRSVDVRVAIRAVLPDIGEHRLGMASGAGNFLVHAAKRVARGVMVEFRNGPDGRPVGVGVAVFAGNIERSVRTTARLPLRVDRPAGEDQQHENEQTTSLSCARNDSPLVFQRAPTLIQKRGVRNSKLSWLLALLCRGTEVGPVPSTDHRCGFSALWRKCGVTESWNGNSGIRLLRLEITYPFTSREAWN